jgi:transglutaminase-like putative cysteine protease
MLGIALALLITAGNGVFAADFFENFDTGKLDEKRWSGAFEITGAEKEIKPADRALFDNDTLFVRLGAGIDARHTLKLSALTVNAPALLTFRYRTEIAARAGQRFTVLIDDAPAASYEGVAAGWRTGRLPLAAGTHTVEFTSTAKRTQVSGGYNAVYLDDVRVIPDAASTLALFPAGAADTFTGAQGSQQLQFTASALRVDGSVKEDAGAVQFAASGGAHVDEDGRFHPEKEGTYTVSARLDGLSAQSGTVTVHGADYLHTPYTYPGTGTTYAGFVKSAKGAPPVRGSASVSITAPPAADFEADAFFLLEGAVTKPSARDYARVEVIKESAQDGGAAAKTPALKTWYLIQGEFCRRIWLPFGTGRYRITVQPFDTVTLTNPPGGGGALRGGSYSEEPLEFFVTNTREEPAGIDGDGRWIYPSYFVQADDFVITNIMHSLTDHLKTEREKIAAVHDYVVSTLTYDQMSFSSAGRARKMDAVSVTANKTAVCEGYANLSAALLRGAGVPVRIVTSKAINHAWNNIYTGGRWLFYDATWDDPVPDRGPEVVGKTYFLLESLTGGGQRHGRSGKAVAGDVE